MLHHVGIEVEPAEIERTARLFVLLGFEQVPPPPTLTEFTWLERSGTQVHLMPTEAPTVPPRAHLAVVVPDFETALRRLREDGFEVECRREHWGAPRALALTPNGNRVELMAAAPERQAP
jgi:catechol 2,3-dioxygenase-like lactoylglutathione lyase family enzyme